MCDLAMLCKNLLSTTRSYRNSYKCIMMIRVNGLMNGSQSYTSIRSHDHAHVEKNQYNSHKRITIGKVVNYSLCSKHTPNRQGLKACLL